MFYKSLIIIKALIAKNIINLLRKAIIKLWKLRVNKERAIK
jgi:hypothetical protein